MPGGGQPNATMTITHALNHDGLTTKTVISTCATTPTKWKKIELKQTNENTFELLLGFLGHVNS